jgi:hypothetical protein
MAPFSKKPSPMQSGVHERKRGAFGESHVNGFEHANILQPKHGYHAKYHGHVTIFCEFWNIFIYYL